MAPLANYVQLFRPERRALWSIGIYAGPSPFELRPHPQLGQRPVLTSDALRPVKAYGVADPFMVRNGREWQMFFEVENRVSGSGEIGLATSVDALSWHFKGIVLKEPFHLSYPHVWEFDGRWYMLPEAAASGGVRLYVADPFPLRWRFHSELIRGDLADATPCYHANRWWIMALEGFRRRDALVIYYADRPEGPWHAHAGNPISGIDRRTARPAGRMIILDGRLIRFAQDSEVNYGRRVRAFRVEELTPDRYVERPAADREILGPSGHGWNATGMHHLDAHELGPNDWIACVDGRRTRLVLPLLDRVTARIEKMRNTA
jgi:hypothetical protein